MDLCRKDCWLSAILNIFIFEKLDEGYRDIYNISGFFFVEIFAKILGIIQEYTFSMRAEESESMAPGNWLLYGPIEWVLPYF